MTENALILFIGVWLCAIVVSIVLSSMGPGDE